MSYGEGQAMTTICDLRWEGQDTAYADDDEEWSMAMTSKYWAFGVFLVWFCRFGTEALYWGFYFLFLINTVLVFICFAFALYRLYQCIRDWFSLLSLPVTWPWVRWVSLIFDSIFWFFFFFGWESVVGFALLGSPWAWLAMGLALLQFFFYYYYFQISIFFGFFFLFCLKVEQINFGLALLQFIYLFFFRF